MRNKIKASYIFVDIIASYIPFQLWNIKFHETKKKYLETLTSIVLWVLIVSIYIEMRDEMRNKIHKLLCEI